MELETLNTKGVLEMAVTGKKGKKELGFENKKPAVVKHEHFVVDDVKYKTCYHCQTDKSLDQYYKNARSWDGLGTICKDCCYKYQQDTKEHISEYSKKYRDEHKEEIAKRAKIYREYNGDKLTEKWKTYREKNKEKLNERERLRRENDPGFRMKKVIGCRIRETIKNQNGIKSMQTMEYIGCTREELIQHLEKQFKPDMSWENYGSEWHVDHILPISKFELTNLEHQLICFNYKNLQPMWKSNNLSKNDKVFRDCLEKMAPFLPQDLYEKFEKLVEDESIKKDSQIAFFQFSKMIEKTFKSS